MGKYIWCEDSGSGYQFWKEIFSTIDATSTVESKKNNTELCKAVSRLYDEGNDYYILMDNAVDNPEVLREMNKLKRDMLNKPNVHLVNIHSFEFALLSFRFLEQWIFAENDPLREKRSGYLEARERFLKIIIDGGTAGELADLRKLLSIAESRNTEQISSRLLYNITRNTGFETTKQSIGKCFLTDCCQWEDRGADDICGLDSSRLSSEEKKKKLIEYSVIKDALEGAGLL
ncbi:MAG: hypothetical protein Q4E57_05135 [Eubacteriales bacterium]|nr:hypothetical protein [Eubacteriales bacterium]